MKSLIIKSLAVSMMAFALNSYSFAQTREIEHDFTEFDAISATSDFKPSLRLKIILVNMSTAM